MEKEREMAAVAGALTPPATPGGEETGSGAVTPSAGSDGSEPLVNKNADRKVTLWDRVKLVLARIPDDNELAHRIIAREQVRRPGAPLSHACCETAYSACA